jgi:hypothetical protein
MNLEQRSPVKGRRMGDAQIKTTAQLGRLAEAELFTKGLGKVKASRAVVPGLGVKLSTTILAGPTVLSAVGACPPHDGVRCRWRINVESAVALSSARQASSDLTTAIVPAGTSFPAVPREPCDLLMVLRGGLLCRPVELGPIDPHAMQNDREFSRDRDLGLAEPTALSEPHPPSLQR